MGPRDLISLPPASNTLTALSRPQVTSRPSGAKSTAVTPVEWAEQAAAHLSRAQLFVFPAVGHGVLDSHVCAADLVRGFLADPIDPQVPACLDRL